MHNVTYCCWPRTRAGYQALSHVARWLTVTVQNASLRLCFPREFPVPCHVVAAITCASVARTCARVPLAACNREILRKMADLSAEEQTFTLDKARY